MTDAIDQAIIDCLRIEPRSSNRHVARMVGISEGSVRSRVRDLTKNNLLRVVAVRNASTMPDPALVFVGIMAERHAIPEIADSLQSSPYVHFLAIGLGPFDIMLSVIMPDRRLLYEFLSRDIGGIQGVLRTESFMALRAVKTFSDRVILG